MGPGGSESLDEDTLGHAGTAEQSVSCSEFLQEKFRQSWREVGVHSKEQKPQQNKQKQSAIKVTTS